MKNILLGLSCFVSCVYISLANAAISMSPSCNHHTKFDLIVKKIHFDVEFREIIIEAFDNKINYKIYFTNEKDKPDHIFGYHFITFFNVHPGTKLKVVKNFKGDYEVKDIQVINT